MTRRPARVAAVSILCLAASAVPGGAAEVTRQGTIVIVGTVAIDPAIPAGTALSASGLAEAGDGMTLHSIGVTGKVTRKGKVGTVRIALPYLWNFAAGSDTPVLVTLTISAPTASQPSTSITVTIPLPEDGAKTPVKIAGAV